MKLGKNKNIEFFPLRLAIVIFSIVGFITLYAHIVEIHPRGPDEEILLQSEVETQIRQWLYEHDKKVSQEKVQIEENLKINVRK